MTFVFEKISHGGGDSLVQVEGAIHEDGRTPSSGILSVRFRCYRRSFSGEVACDEYHRYQKTLTLSKELGVNAYRLSIAWPRIVPWLTARSIPKAWSITSRY